MPNWCECSLDVYGPAADLAGFAAAARGTNNPTEEGAESSPLWFDSLLPTPPELQDSGWYDWRVEHWGTKWNAVDVDASGVPEDEWLSYFFMSAWSPPKALLRHASDLWPSLEFHLLYAEAGMDFSGEIVLRGGKPVRDEQGGYGDYYGG